MTGEPTERHVRPGKEGKNEKKTSTCVFKCLDQAHSSDTTARCRGSDASIRNRRF